MSVSEMEQPPRATNVVSACTSVPTRTSYGVFGRPQWISPQKSRTQRTVCSSCLSYIEHTPLNIATFHWMPGLVTHPPTCLKFKRLQRTSLCVRVWQWQMEVHFFHWWDNITLLCGSASFLAVGATLCDISHPCEFCNWHPQRFLKIPSVLTSTKRLATLKFHLTNL